jgi:hypothetical protein
MESKMKWLMLMLVMVMIPFLFFICDAKKSRETLAVSNTLHKITTDKQYGTDIVITLDAVPVYKVKIGERLIHKFGTKQW